jgi:hypothetical protein
LEGNFSRVIRARSIEIRSQICAEGSCAGLAPLAKRGLANQRECNAAESGQSDVQDDPDHNGKDNYAEPSHEQNTKRVRSTYPSPVFAPLIAVFVVMHPEAASARPATTTKASHLISNSPEGKSIGGNF